MCVHMQANDTHTHTHISHLHTHTTCMETLRHTHTHTNAHTHTHTHTHTHNPPPLPTHTHVHAHAHLHTQASAPLFPTRISALVNVPTTRFIVCVPAAIFNHDNRPAVMFIGMLALERLSVSATPLQPAIETLINCDCSLPTQPPPQLWGSANREDV